MKCTQQKKISSSAYHKCHPNSTIQFNLCDVGDRDRTSSHFNCNNFKLSCRTLNPKVFATNKEWIEWSAKVCWAFMRFQSLHFFLFFFCIYFAILYNLKGNRPLLEIHFAFSADFFSSFSLSSLSFFITYFIYHARPFTTNIFQ